MTKPKPVYNWGRTSGGEKHEPPYKPTGAAERNRDTAYTISKGKCVYKTDDRNQIWSGEINRNHREKER